MFRTNCSIPASKTKMYFLLHALHVKRLQLQGLLKTRYNNIFFYICAHIRVKNCFYAELTFDEVCGRALSTHSSKPCRLSS
jgi:hypothetical protein